MGAPGAGRLVLGFLRVGPGAAGTGLRTKAGSEVWPSFDTGYSGERESARGPTQPKTLSRLTLLPNERSVVECGGSLRFLFADVDDGEDQANQTAEVTRIVDVSDPDEARQVHDSQSGCHALPRRII